MKVKIQRRAIVAVLGAVGVMNALPSFAQVADYPNRPVTLIVSYPPGGSSDLITRLMANELAKFWGQPVVVENKPGAGGSLGAAVAAKAPADGYTLFMGSIATHAINSALYKNLGFDPVKDFAPISRVSTVPNVLVVNNQIPVNNLQDLLKWVREDSRRAFYASPGAGTSPHLSSELLKAQAKIEMTNVPYKGDSPALADVMAGQVPMAIVNLPSAMGLIRGEKVRPLAVTSRVRAHELPDVPTMEEGGVPNYDVTSWWALFAPAGISPNLAAKINHDVVTVLRSAAAIEGVRKMGSAAAPSTQGELATLVTSETERWGKLIREKGITAN